MPWVLLPLPIVLSYASPQISRFSLALVYLFVPWAALMARRHGMAGVVVVAVGGLVLTLPRIIDIPGAFGGAPTVYLVGLAVAGIAASPRSIEDQLQWMARRDIQTLLPFVVALLVPLSFSVVGGQGSMERIHSSASLGLWLPGHCALLFMGWMGARWRPVWLGLAVAALLSWTLGAEHLNLVGDRSLNLYYRVLQPVDMASLTLAFSAGRALDRARRGAPEPWGLWGAPYAAVIAVVLFWFGFGPLSDIPLDEPLPPVRWAGAGIALPIVAVMAGALLHRRGVILVTLAAILVPALWLALDYVSEELLDLGSLRIAVALEAPLVAAAYGLLGRAIVASETVRTAPAARFGRLAKYAAVILAAAAALFDTESPKGLVAAGIFVAISLAIYWFAARLRQASAGTPYEITPAGWLGLVTVLVVAASLIENINHAVEAARKVPEMIASLSALDADDLADLYGFAALVLALYLLATAGVIAGAIKTLPKICSDAARLVRLLKPRLLRWRAALSG